MKSVLICASMLLALSLSWGAADPVVNFQPGGLVITGDGIVVLSTPDTSKPSAVNTQCNGNLGFSGFVAPGVSIGLFAGGVYSDVYGSPNNYEYRSADLSLVASYYIALSEQFVLAPSVALGAGTVANYVDNASTIPWAPSVNASGRLAAYYFATDFIAPYVMASYKVTDKLPNTVTATPVFAGETLLVFGMSFWMPSSARSLFK